MKKPKTCHPRMLLSGINMIPAFAGMTALIVLFGGCGSKASDNAPSIDVQTTPAETPPSAQKKLQADPAEAATIRGKITFEGTAPAPKAISIKGNPECAVLHPGGTIQSEDLIVTDGNLQNVFVYVKEGLEGRTFAPPATPVVIENTKCAYVPHVLGVQVGQPVTLLNGDETLHNMHTYSKENKAWNLGFPFKGMKQTKTFTSPEIMVTLKCDVHPWMIGYLGVLPHPYFSVTGESGEFELKGLPPGEYLVEAIHEKFGAQSQKIRIEPRETKEIAFKYGP